MPKKFGGITHYFERWTKTKADAQSKAKKLRAQGYNDRVRPGKAVFCSHCGRLSLKEQDTKRDLDRIKKAF